MVRLEVSGVGVFDLDGAGPWLVGRAPDCNVAVPHDPQVSRRHFELRRDDGRFVLTPLSAGSPTFVNGEPAASRTPLRGGEEIRAGGTVMRVAVDSAVRSQGRTGGTLSGKLLGQQQRLVIGRQPGSDGLTVDHPSVSRQHAELRRTGDAFALRDLRSTNGTFVNGLRIGGPVTLGEGDRIGIGPAIFVFQAGGVVSRMDTGPVSIKATGVAIDVPAKGGTRRILQPTDLEIPRGEFVCIIGGSGAGKSTLMSALAGRAPVTTGAVEIEGHDVGSEFSSLKQFVAYLPQKESLHESLTLRQALLFVAELRLPPDTPADEREQRVLEAIRDVELEAHVDTVYSRLSGGQKKRACLAAELLCKPRVLFLDEVTSGLDEHTDQGIMSLLQRVARTGTTIVCVTHTLANIDPYCDRVVVMAPGGYLVFSGPPATALEHFGIATLGGVFAVVGNKGAEWAQRFGATPVAAGARPPKAAATRGPGPMDKVFTALKQFDVLVRRNLVLLAADRRTLILALAQALVIGIAVGVSFREFGDGFMQTSSQKVLLTLLTMAAFWIGCSISAKDIVAEAAILQRERDVNLMVAPYVSSKLVVVSLFMVTQVALMFLCVWLLAEDIPGGLLKQLMLTCVSSLLGVAMGLFISALSQSESQAITIVPLVVIPQLIFVGTLVPNMPDGLADAVAWVVPTNVLNAAMQAVLVDVAPVIDIDLNTGLPLPLEVRELETSLGLLGLQYGLFVAATFAAIALRYSSGRK